MQVYTIMKLEFNRMYMSTCYSCFQKFNLILMTITCLRLINQSQHCVMIVVTLKMTMWIDWSLYSEDSNNQVISPMLHQLMHLRGEYLENYRCVDRCQKLSTSKKAGYVTQLSDAVIIQLNIFKYIDGVIKKFIPSLRIDEKISLGGIRMVLSGISCLS